MIPVKVKKLDSKAKLPTRGSEFAAGADLYACVDGGTEIRGEIIVALHNHGDEPQRIEDGERIAQIVVTPFLNAAFVEADSLAETERGEGGFGSTGRK